MSKIRLTGTIRIPTAEQDHILPLLAKHLELTNAEPGCEAFSVTVHPYDAQIFDVSELFTDQSAFDFHQARGKSSDWGRVSAHLIRDFTVTTD